MVYHAIEDSTNGIEHVTKQSVELAWSIGAIERDAEGNAQIAVNKFKLE